MTFLYNLDLVFYIQKYFFIFKDTSPRQKCEENIKKNDFEGADENALHLNRLSNELKSQMI